MFQSVKEEEIQLCNVANYNFIKKGIMCYVRMMIFVILNENAELKWEMQQMCLSNELNEVFVHYFTIMC